MNKKLLFFLILLIILLIFFLFKNKKIENYQEIPVDSCISNTNLSIELVNNYKLCQQIRKIINDKYSDFEKKIPIWEELDKLIELKGSLKNKLKDDILAIIEFVSSEYDSEPDQTKKQNILNKIQIDKTYLIHLEKKYCKFDVDSAIPCINKNAHQHYGDIKLGDTNDTAWANKKLNGKVRYKLPIKNVKRIVNEENTDFSPILGDLNMMSPIIQSPNPEKEKFKWYKNGIFEDNPNPLIINTGIISDKGPDKTTEYISSNQFKEQETATDDTTKKFTRNWRGNIHPWDAGILNGEVSNIRNSGPSESTYIDHVKGAYPIRSLKNKNNQGNPNIEEMMEKWGTQYKDSKYTMKKDPLGHPFASVGNTIKDEPPLNKITTKNSFAYDGLSPKVLNDMTKSCNPNRKIMVQGTKIPVIPLAKMYKVFPEKYKNYKDLDEFIEAQTIVDLKKLEEHQYKRKMIPKKILENTDKSFRTDIDLFGKPFSKNAQEGYNGNTRKGNKILPDSGYDASQYVDDQGNLIFNPVARLPMKVVKEKKCPPPVKHRYYYEKPGLLQYSEWYIGEVGGSFADGSTPKMDKNSANIGCKRCSNPGGCRYPNATNGKYSTDYFEKQTCKGDKDRICKKCKTCKMGREVVQTDCGEGGGKNDRSCCICSECKDGTYKVYGCDKPNSFFDTECKPMSKCQGFKPDKTQLKEMSTIEKYNKLGTFNSDPGEGKRQFKLKDGRKGGYADRKANKEGTKEQLQNPYFGRDVMCSTCDTCPPGWKHLRGCFGTSDNENTVCQRSYNKESYLKKDLTCPLSTKGKKQFYNKDSISKYIDEENKKLEKSDEIVRQKKKKENDEILKNPNLLRTKELINLNDPEILGPMKEITNAKLIEMGCQECKDCNGEIEHINSETPGCFGSTNTICKPHTPCLELQYVSKKGDKDNDQICSSCRCPQPDYHGFPDCTKINKDKVGEIMVPTGCIKKTICEVGEFVSKDPGLYGDTTKDRTCKKCKKCLPGTFEVKGGCREGGGTDTICKNWKKCDKKTMLVVEPGTSTTDTICKCIDGYELPKHLITGKENIESTKCIVKKGKCHTNPCHPKANCFDNFTDDGDYLNTICECDIDKGFIQTEEKGFGKEGCFNVPGKHPHEIKTPSASYGDLPPKFAKILTHLDKDYHRKKTSTHLHKVSPLDIDNYGNIITEN